MKLGRLSVALILLTCLIPLCFVGNSYLAHAHRIDVDLRPYPFLAVWLVVALFLYWKWVYESPSWIEVLRFVLYCVALTVLLFLGLTASFWAVVSIYGL